MVYTFHIFWNNKVLCRWSKKARGRFPVYKMITRVLEWMTGLYMSLKTKRSTCRFEVPLTMAQLSANCKVLLCFSIFTPINCSLTCEFPIHSIHQSVNTWNKSTFRSCLSVYLYLLTAQGILTSVMSCLSVVKFDSWNAEAILFFTTWKMICVSIHIIYAK